MGEENSWGKGFVRRSVFRRGKNGLGGERFRYFGEEEGKAF